MRTNSPPLERRIALLAAFTLLSGAFVQAKPLKIFILIIRTAWGGMGREQQDAFRKDYRAKLIPPADEAAWKRGASNAGYHYIGCAKAFAVIGKAFAEGANGMMRDGKGI